MVVVTTFAPPVEGVIHQQPSTRVFVDQQEIGTGTLYITESSLLWGGGSSAEGSTTAPAISLQYRRISLHAVQREPTPCLYIMLDYVLRLPELENTGAGDSEEMDENFDAEESPLTELRFIPADEESVSTMFQAMTHCQILHPDPQDDDSDEDYYHDGDMGEDDEEEFQDALENEQSPANGDENVRRLRALRLEQSNSAHSNGVGEETESDQFADN